MAHEGDGASEKSLLRITIKPTAIECICMKSKYADSGLVIESFRSIKEDLVQVMARIGKETFKYVWAWVSLDQLRELPSVKP